jgi:phosphoglycolate phosphatase
MTTRLARSTRRFDLIAFDWDGTLYDSTALIVRCIQLACRDLNLSVPSDADAAYVIGLGLHDALRHAVPGLAAERYPELGLRYREHYWAHKDDLVLFPGTLAMLQALKERQHLLAVATGKNRRGLDDALAQAELHGVFDATRTADETAGKPHPLMLRQLMAELGVAPERTLMIGDTTHDLEMAGRAGVAGLGVSYGAHDHAAFEAHGPVFVAHSTRELHDWLLEHA